MPNRGFTLIELLLVISIISLLSSILIAMSSESRRKSEDGYKKIQVKEVEKAIALYRNEYGYVPDDYIVDQESFAQ